MINGIVALFVGLYLLLVLWRGREGQMIALISEQVGFFKWAGALLTLAYIYNAVPGKTGDVVKGLTTLALIAMLLANGEKLFADVETLFKPDESESKKPVGAWGDFLNKF